MGGLIEDRALRPSCLDRLAENPSNLAAVFDSLSDGVYFVDKERRIQEWNAGAVALTGFTPEDVRQRSCPDNILVHVDECGTELCLNGCPLHQTLLDGQSRQAKVTLRHKQGYRVPVLVRTVPVRDSNSRIIGAIETFREIGGAEQWKARIRELEHAAYIDALTGIPNRRFLETQIERLLREQDATGECFPLLMIDLDEFKSVNDSFGHETGDRVLCNISQTLMNSLRGRDILGRWGGDEFVMLLSAANKQQATALAERCRVLVMQTATPNGSEYVKLTVSIGVAISAPKDTRDQVLKRADQQLYLAKHNGRNCCCLE
jgi:diguanylate cyclase (GGDEF)-like protein/PAS domain S-box-containing protein